MPRLLPLPVPCFRVLRFGGFTPSRPDPCAELITAAGLTLLALPPEPPVEPEAFRQLTRQARFALIDLDLGAASLRWLRAFRERHPVVPVIAVYARAGLPDLLAAGALGLDGALRLPAPPAAIAAALAPWLPPPVAAPHPVGSHDTVLLAPRAGPLSATHLSPASDANQALLGGIDAHHQATRFVVTGPAGAEFTLVAYELAARRGVAPADIAFPGLPAPPRTALLVTADLGLFLRSSAPLNLLIMIGSAANERPDATREMVRLSLKPLHSRLPDVAHYLRRWLPDIFAANHRDDAPLPLSCPWRHAFLAHHWPGEFTELYRALHRFSLLPAGDPPPPGFLAPCPPEAGFETVAATQIPRSYRARLARRVPAERLSATLAILGFPELPAQP